MRKSAVYGFSVLMAGLAFLLVPVHKEDSSDLTIKEIECGQIGAHLTFENGIERALIRDIAVTHKVGEMIYVSSYTFGGIQMSEVAVNCRRGTARRM